MLVDAAEGKPDLILIATGSEVHLAVDAAKLLDVSAARRRAWCRCRRWKLFDAQDEAYRETVLPADVRARMSIEAGATIGWTKYVGDRGIAFGLDHFGTSAPAAAIAQRIRVHT